MVRFNTLVVLYGCFHQCVFLARLFAAEEPGQGRPTNERMSIELVVKSNTPNIAG